MLEGRENNLLQNVFVIGSNYFTHVNRIINITYKIVIIILNLPRKFLQWKFFSLSITSFTHTSQYCHMSVSRIDNTPNQTHSLGLGVQSHTRTFCVFFCALVNFIPSTMHGFLSPILFFFTLLVLLYYGYFKLFLLRGHHGGNKILLASTFPGGSPKRIIDNFLGYINQFCVLRLRAYNLVETPVAQ